jgi:hypothetical protein
MKKLIVLLLVLTLSGCVSSTRTIKGSDVTFKELNATSFTCTINYTANADIEWFEVQIYLYDEFNNFVRSNTERAINLVAGNDYILKIFDESKPMSIGHCGQGVRYEIKSLTGSAKK